jgi:hypothetical protein
MRFSMRFGGAGAALALAGMVTASTALLAQDKPKPRPAKPAPVQPAAPTKPATPTRPATARPAEQAKPAPAVSAPGKGTADRYTATATNLGGVTGETITVDLIRWSTDAERDKVVATLKDKGEKELLTVLQQAPNIGYIWRSGSGFGSFVRYAFRWKAADGEHVVLATDSDLNTWKQVGAPITPGAPQPEPQFTVIELVRPGAAAAAGKMSLGAKVVSDADAKTIRLENYTAAPVTLKGVRHQQGGR